MESKGQDLVLISQVTDYLLLGIVANGESEERHHKCDARRVKTLGALSQFAFSPPYSSVTEPGLEGVKLNPIWMQRASVL
jgi:hypothetical protein